MASISCFRSSLINGIGGGVAGGLVYFLFTSKFRQACNIAVLSFTGITLSYWLLFLSFFQLDFSRVPIRYFTYTTNNYKYLNIIKN